MDNEVLDLYNTIYVPEIDYKPQVCSSDSTVEDFLTFFATLSAGVILFCMFCKIKHRWFVNAKSSLSNSIGKIWKGQCHCKPCENCIRINGFPNSARSLTSTFSSFPNSTFNEKSNCNSTATKCTLLSDISILPEDEGLREFQATEDILTFDNDFCKFTNLKKLDERSTISCGSSPTSFSVDDSVLLNENSSQSSLEITSSKDAPEKSICISLKKSILADGVDMRLRILSLVKKLYNQNLVIEASKNKLIKFNEDIINLRAENASLRDKIVSLPDNKKRHGHSSPENLQQSIKINQLERQISEKNDTIGKLEDLCDKTMAMFQEMRHKYQILSDEHGKCEQIRRPASIHGHNEKIEDNLSKILNAQETSKTISKEPRARRPIRTSSSSQILTSSRNDSSSSLSTSSSGNII
ncbi:uncharacterized protein LOC106653474 [Trichogramma pretiosum]|uniref:uncharacterized protein LOC106653474 n=1 Tax=Trichogramma pretiosum TaxID=7493 RepID=UPI0006C9C3FA|nr:uncharacterized protein LOC106653474 [Trichogramma pretiosum]